MSRHHRHSQFLPLTGDVVRVADPMAALGRQVGRLFNDFRDPALAQGGEIGPMDITEGDKDYEIDLEVPGCSEKDIDISAEEGMLRIAGEKKEPKQSEDKKHHVQGRSFSSFDEEISIPDDADVKSISASLKNGVLHVTLPKKPQEKPHKNKVKIDVG